MKNRCLVILLITGVLFSIKNVSANSDNVQRAIANSHQRYFPGELLVKFKSGVSTDKTESLHHQLGVSEVRRGLKDIFQIITVAAGKEQEMAREYLQKPEVEYAEPNYYRSINSTPNDPLYDLQWHFPLINLPDAWDISTGTDVTVAVIDTGVNPFGFDGFGNRILWGYNAILKIPGGRWDRLQ